MRRILAIGVAILCIGSGMFSSVGSGMFFPSGALSAKAKAPTAAQLPIEQEQAFTYYWYAAKQALEHEEYSRAYMLLRRCESINPYDGQTHEYLGLLNNAIGQKEVALSHFEQAYQNEPSLWKSYVQAMPRDKKGRIQKAAIRIVEQATRREPKEAQNWDILRQVYTEAKKYSKAIRAQDRMDQIVGYDAYSAINRYRIYAIQRKNTKAIAEIDRYLEQDPTNLRFLLFRMELLERTAAPWSKIEACYQRILQLDPNNLLVLNNYAYGSAIRGGDLREAERMSQRTIQAEPENPVYLDTYAWILHLQGQDTLAAFYIRKALNNASEETKQEIQQHYEDIIH